MEKMVNLWHHSPHNAQKISMSWEEKGKKTETKTISSDANEYFSRRQEHRPKNTC